MKKELGLREASVVAYERPGSYRGYIYLGNNINNTINNTIVSLGGLAGQSWPGVRFIYLLLGD